MGLKKAEIAPVRAIAGLKAMTNCGKAEVGQV